jgi:Na+/H+ antiporter NhaC
MVRMFSVLLNIITLIIVFFVAYFFFTSPENVKKKMNTASEVLAAQLKDPVVTSRAYFTERKNGSTGSFVGNFPWEEKEWLHGYPLSQA